MMKKLFIILSLLLIVFTGCNNEVKKPTNSKEEGSAIMFDHENTFKIIQERLECGDVDAQIILEYLQDAKVKGVVKAERVEDDSFESMPVVLEIESENHKIYRVYMTTKYSVEAIKDMETGKYVYASVM